MTLSRKKGMKNMKKKITALMLAVLTVLAVLSGCNAAGNGTKDTTDTTPTPSGSSGEGTTAASGTDAPDDYVLKVATLKGPTGMGMAKMINDDKDAKKYDFTISSPPTSPPRLFRNRLTSPQCRSTLPPSSTRKQTAHILSPR